MKNINTATTSTKVKYAVGSCNKVNTSVILHVVLLYVTCDIVLACDTVTCDTVVGCEPGGHVGITGITTGI